MNKDISNRLVNQSQLESQLNLLSYDNNDGSNITNIQNNNLINYIIKLQIFCNNYYKFDLDYIKLKLNLNSYNEFKLLFKNKYKSKLLFSSIKSENLFINFMNFDKEYFTLKYKEDQINKLLNFFICNENLYLNNCHENLNSESGDFATKNHINNCNCNIKVKSIVNLEINTLINIINSNLYTKNKKNILKIHKNDKNIKLINTFNKLEKIAYSFGINNDIHYTLQSSDCDDEPYPSTEIIENLTNITMSADLLSSTTNCNKSFMCIIIPVLPLTPLQLTSLHLKL